MMTEKTSNRINWPPITIALMARRGYRPFLGYWVKLGDDKLYLLEELT
jgi:hypothetical protein